MKSVWSQGPSLYGKSTKVSKVSEVSSVLSSLSTQGQSVNHVGLDLRNAVFTHGQLYVAVSRVTYVHNIKAIWDPRFAQLIRKNIVYLEVIID